MRDGRWEDVVILRTNKLKLIKKYYISYYTGQKSKEIKAAEKRFRALNVYSILIFVATNHYKFVVACTCFGAHHECM